MNNGEAAVIDAVESNDGQEYAIQTRRKLVRPRGLNQREYLKNIRDNDLAFGIGPAGTGKTYLAVASAIDALESEQVRRIVLVRPAVEAGERLGFLPGDMSQKVDPYLRPMYDALYDMLGTEQVSKLIEKNIIDGDTTTVAFVNGEKVDVEKIWMKDGAQVITTTDGQTIKISRGGHMNKKKKMKN